MQNIVELRHLSKRYGDRTVVDDLSFTIPAGHVVGLIGPNGSGKTTTMKMLLGLVTPSGGDITLLDAEVGSAGWGGALKRVGSMIEAPPIYLRMTARENLQYQSLALTGQIDEDDVSELLTLVDLAERADDRPRGYSLGMKQRLGVALAMVADPALVILDEPGNGLDPAGIIELRRLVRRLPETGTTVLISSHQLAEVQQACDELVVLANGRTVAQGATNEILSGTAGNQFVVTVGLDEVTAAAGALRANDVRIVEGGDGGRLVVEPRPGLGGADLNRLLVSAGIYASTISPLTVSLEDAFLELVNSSNPQAPNHTLEGASR